MPRNVAQLVRDPSYRPTERRQITHAEQAAILDAARDEDLGVAIFLVHATGMRLSEVLVKTACGRRWLPRRPVTVALLREHRRRQGQQRAQAAV